MAYVYDAFFSYRRNVESNFWHERLKDKIKFWLDDALNKDAQIFFDTEDIPLGALWREEIGSALLASKCLICVWSPKYFQSDWCVAEWQTFEERSKKYDKRLVLGANFSDGDHYPAEAKERLYKDFRPWALTIPAFWDSEKAIDFEDQAIKPFVEKVAEAVNSAPDFCTDFPLIDTPGADQIAKKRPIGRIGDV